ncbi:hypothetical protein JRO89_XS09G0246600 [Xanthoceras sorbifolium]|uniref:Cyclic nucleotide-binding domain-containing protein n=1 Tax=Xanthoceras sorbifolium TaxID=99658 RepID=A0ABQ8HMW6_9ROSI|nr:hypothetical protein JRO89_XS09G0246600 [Xanthoceras sorbifolium]
MKAMLKKEVTNILEGKWLSCGGEATIGSDCVRRQLGFQVAAEEILRRLARLGFQTVTGMFSNDLGSCRNKQWLGLGARIREATVSNWSQDNLEGGTPRHPPRELTAESDGTNSAVGNFQREQPSGVVVEVPRIRGTTECRFTVAVAKHWSQMEENLSPQGSLRSLILVLSCLSGALVDPLFLYIPVLNNARKCIGYDKVLGIVAITLRTISDILYMIYIIIPLWNRLRSDSRKLLWIILLHYIMAIIPLPQVLMLLIFAGKWKGDQIVSAATLILWQHALRLLIMVVFVLIGCAQYAVFLCFFYSPHYIRCFNSQKFWSDIPFLPNAVGVDLMAFLVTQRHLRSKAERLENRKLKVVAINKWKPFKTLSLNIQLEVVEEYLQCQETENVNAENLFNDLSSHLKRSIKHQLCFEMLKKVEEFGKWSEDMLYHMCDYVKPVFYMEDTHIVWERDLIDQMLFVLQGRLRMYSFSCSASDTTRHRGIRYIPRVHENGDFCREELVAWFQADPYSSNLPISTRTIRTATRVEGFALMSEDLRVVLIEHHKALFIQSYWRTKMMRSDASLVHLCDCLEPVLYAKRSTFIFHEGKPINGMLLVLLGKLWTFASEDTSYSTGSANNARRESIKDLMKEGDFCSEELVDWVQNEPSSIHPTNLFHTNAFNQLQKLKLLFLGLMT